MSFTEQKMFMRIFVLAVALALLVGCSTTNNGGGINPYLLNQSIQQGNQNLANQLHQQNMQNKAAQDAAYRQYEQQLQQQRMMDAARHGQGSWQYNPGTGRNVWVPPGGRLEYNLRTKQYEIVN